MGAREGVSAAAFLGCQVLLNDELDHRSRK